MDRRNPKVKDRMIGGKKTPPVVVKVEDLPDDYCMNCGKRREVESDDLCFDCQEMFEEGS